MGAPSPAKPKILVLIGEDGYKVAIDTLAIENGNFQFQAKHRQGEYVAGGHISWNCNIAIVSRIQCFVANLVATYFIQIKVGAVLARGGGRPLDSSS